MTANALQPVRPTPSPPRRRLFRLFLLLAVPALIAPSLSAGWRQIISFDNLDENTVSSVVHVTRDDGGADGHMRHEVVPDGAGGNIYMLGNRRLGSRAGHVFAAIPLDEPITEQGTLYFQFLQIGPWNDFVIALATEAPEPVDPPDEANPLGWRGPSVWNDMVASIQNPPNRHIHLMDGIEYRETGFTPELGVWYEFWMTVDVVRERYSLHVRGGEYEAQTPLQIDVDGERFDYSYFRTRERGALRSIAIGTLTNIPDGRWYINNLAIDFIAHNLSDPPVPPPAPAE